MGEARPKKPGSGGSVRTDLPPTEPEWAKWWSDVVMHLKWSPETINELTFAQIAALCGGGQGERMEFKSMEDLKPHVEAYLEREKPENALREAMEAYEATLRGEM